MTSVIFLTIIVIYKSICQMISNSRNPAAEPLLQEIKWARFDLGLLRTFGILCFAFTCHFNVLSIHNELKRATKKRWFAVVNSSMLFCIVMYSLVGAFGYLSFKDDVDGNLLLGYDDDIVIIVGKLAICVTIVFSYPLLAHPCKMAIEQMAQTKPSETGARGPTLARNIAETLGIAAFTYVVSIFVDDIATVFNIVGGTVNSLLCFCFPALLYIRLFPQPYLQKKEDEHRRKLQQRLLEQQNDQIYRDPEVTTSLTMDSLSSPSSAPNVSRKSSRFSLSLPFRIPSFGLEARLAPAYLMLGFGMFVWIASIIGVILGMN